MPWLIINAYSSLYHITCVIILEFQVRSLINQSHTKLKIKPKLDYIYHFPSDLEQQTDICLVPNQLENGKYNQISV